jgi:hypothetical protein
MILEHIQQRIRAALAALAVSAIATVPDIAAAQDRDCSLARDPERCVLQQAALAECAELRSKDKQACLEAKLPPPDCSKAPNPARCESIERAKQRCAGTTGKALKACLKGEAPAKAKKAAKAKSPKGKKEAKKDSKQAKPAPTKPAPAKPKGPPPVRLDGS